MRFSVAVVVACFSLAGLVAADDANAAIRRPTSIPAQELGAALQTFAQDRGFQIVYVSDEVSSLRTQGAAGELTLEEALAQLLAGTGMTYRYFGESAVSIVPVAATSPAPQPISPAARPRTGESDSDGARSGSRPDAAGRRSFLERFRLAKAQTADDGTITNAAPDPTGTYTAGAQEIVVTAQKRLERLQDVPVPVSSISAARLVDNNQVRLQDYFTQVPGLNFTSGNRGEPFVAIRGITTSPFTNPTVGITVDDIPYGPTSLRGGGLITPDIDPSDLARVEVLRGPQGTLYGVSSLGGLIKFVTVDPSTESVSGEVQSSLSSIRNGDDVGYYLRGAVNVPLSETLAVRASAFTRRNPGYIDNPGAGVEGANQGDSHGGRVAALWRPSAAFSLKLGALFQESDMEGSPLVYRLPGLGDLEQSYLRGSGWLKREFQAYSATATAALGSAELTSLTGYNVNKLADSTDTSPFFGGVANARFGVTGAPITDDYETEKFSQEVRVLIPAGERFEWLLGGFFTDEKSSNEQRVLAVNPATGATAGAIGYLKYPTTYEEYAGFVDLTVHFTDRFDVQVGGRQSHNEQTYSDTGPLLVAGPPTPTITITDSPFTYLLTPRFKVSPDLMLYARFASGYRAGGINTTALSAAVPAGFDADTTRNYEIGAKGNFFAHELTVDASVYYIDWQDIQLNYLSTTGVAFQSNGSSAKSQGIELSVSAQPLAGLTLAAATTWNDARLTEDFGSASVVRGFDGDRLPFSSRLTGSLSADQQFGLSSGSTVSVGGVLSYIGDRKGLFQAGPVRQRYPSYTQLDVHAGLDVGSWSGNLFVTNLTDKRGVLGGGIGNISPRSFFYTQPRTFGVSLSKSF